MKKRIIKIISVLFLLTIIMIQLNAIYAKTVDAKIKYTIDDFCKSLERNSSLAYNYIDGNNKELSDNIKKYKDSIQKLEFTTKNITEKDGITTVTGNIEAKGDNWNVEGFTVKFNLKNVNGMYKITDTDLFYIISPEHTFKFVGSIFGIVFGIIGVIFVIITVTVVIVVVVVTKNKKKKKASTNTEKNVSAETEENKESKEE